MGLKGVSNRKAYSRLYRELQSTLPSAQILRDPVSTLAYGSDASFYRLIPEIVVKAITEKEAVFVLGACSRLRLPVTFRAAGTSLSGQAVSNSVLLQIGREFGSAQVLDGGIRIRLQPAVTGSAANRLLARHGRKLGPDPASIDSAMIGGIAANNASGMCCGVTQNCYRTLDSMRLVLVDGTVLDTSTPGSRASFASTHGDLLEGLSVLASEVQNDADLKALIVRKYAMKNTTGYSLNALVDFRDPFEILQHLIIGSEGTLAFISEITLRTVPDPKCKTAILAIFQDLESVSGAILGLAKLNVQAVEYMDEASMLSLADHPQFAAILSKPAAAHSQTVNYSALLIDVRAEDSEELQRRSQAVLACLSKFPCLIPPTITICESEYNSLWAIRKGLFPAIGATRPSGTTLIIEDVAFPIARLAEALLDLRTLLDTCGYKQAIIYGHALSGNLHFVIWQDFSLSPEIERYAGFMEKLADMVVEKYQGSMKAEHGTGRNMAPFVEKEWGRRAYEVMKRIKTLFDPMGLLNPDVILSSDKRIHLKNLKPLPLTDPIVDQCSECGFCENACPSRNATLTPRQRIVVRREISRLRGVPGPRKSRADRRRLQGLVRGFRYQGEKTCATDGMCARKCPVGIDTGKFVQSIRAESKPWWQQSMVNLAADHFGIVLGGFRFGLRLLRIARNLLGAKRVSRALRVLHRIAPKVVPAGLEFLPGPGRAISPALNAKEGAPRVLYFPSCINRAFGPERLDDKPLPEIMDALLRQAGFEVVVFAGINQLCCGLAFASKGFTLQGNRKMQETRAALTEASAGCVAIVCDTSPCTQRLLENLKLSVAIRDSASFLESILPRLQVRKSKATVALHPTCSVTKMGLAGSLESLAKACTENVLVLDTIPCCGVAGDRIFMHPEMPLSACAPLRTAFPKDCREAYSTSRTCEIGLTQASGIPYRSILYLLHEQTIHPQTV